MIWSTPFRVAVYQLSDPSACLLCCGAVSGLEEHSIECIIDRLANQLVLFCCWVHLHHTQDLSSLHCIALGVQLSNDFVA